MLNYNKDLLLGNQKAKNPVTPSDITVRVVNDKYYFLKPKAAQLAKKYNISGEDLAVLSVQEHRYSATLYKLAIALEASDNDVLEGSMIAQYFSDCKELAADKKAARN
jgi:hypothetical protein